MKAIKVSILLQYMEAPPRYLTLVAFFVFTSHFRTLHERRESAWTA